MKTNFLASRAASRALPAGYAERVNAVMATTVKAFAANVAAAAEQYRRTGVKPSKIKHGAAKNGR